jgi:hypothetical protein
VNHSCLQAQALDSLLLLLLRACANDPAHRIMFYLEKILVCCAGEHSFVRRRRKPVVHTCRECRLLVVRLLAYEDVAS